MDSPDVSVTDQEIADLAAVLDGAPLPAGGGLPASGLLRKLVEAISAAADAGQEVTVAVEVVESLAETVDASFTPEPPAGGPVAEFHAAAATAGGRQVSVRVMKIGPRG